MSFVRNGDVKIHYETYGSKNSENTLVFLHGAGSDMKIWKNQVKELKNDFFIVLIDFRGSGKSDVPEYKYNAEMLASDVDEVLLAEKLDVVDLIGYSMGGLVAQKYANNHSNKINKLILMNCSLGGGNPDIVLPKKEVVNMFLYAPVLSTSDAVKNAIDYNFGKNIENNNPLLYKASYNDVLRNIEGIKYQLWVMLSAKPLVNDYSKLTMPILYILSKKDMVTPIENDMVIKKYLPHSNIQYLEGHHASMLIHPDKVTELIRSFIKKNIPNEAT